MSEKITGQMTEKIAEQMTEKIADAYKREALSDIHMKESRGIGCSAKG